MRSLLFCLIGCLCLASQMAPRAWAQEPAVPHDWLMDDKRYRQDPDENGTRAGCCATSHCRPAKPEDFERMADGALCHLPTGSCLPMTSRAIYLSADPERRSWVCIIGGRMVCAALAGEG